ncbi:epimerase [Massilia horti]|uniref:Epimerase n=1 Tax=Massilia horti TaxID=2562153 RepID=A0A4Y9T5T9_9BURK|nr:epimerase [Massilia horti]TFW33443.1 epimerase [Massilia horti]
MKVVIFGATGMVGQGVLRECLAAPDVELVKTIGRNPTGQRHPKLRELVHAEMWDYEGMDEELDGFDACFYCIGVSPGKLGEQQYTHIVRDMAVNAGAALSRVNPRMVFVYVSILGADSTEKSRLMWERVRGKTENALLALPFRAVYVLRPGMIQPLDGIKSKTPAYRIFYSLFKPVLPLLHRALPNLVVTTRQMGQAMLNVVRRGAQKRVLEAADINALSRS